MFDFLSSKFSSIFSRLNGNKQLTEANIQETLEKVHEALLEADVPYAVVQAFIQEVKQDVIGKKLTASLKPAEQLMKIVHDKLIAFLGGQSGELFTFQIPSVVMAMGLQGSGKTTTLAKIAHFVQETAHKRGKKRSVLMASLDFYRPAAIDQLEILAAKSEASFYRAISTDPVQAAQEILLYSQKNSYEILLLDTAGRLHVDGKLLEELQRIEKIVRPKYKILVLDAMTGQESLEVAKAFEQAVGFTGTILTKIDSNSRGGAAFAFKYMLKKPVLFLGTGEKKEDLEAFRPERMATRILGMGDITSLIEKATEKINQVEQDRISKAFVQGSLTLEDFAHQIEMINKLGSLSNIVKYLPGAQSLEISPDMLNKGEVEMRRFKAIISSMTPAERKNYKLLNASRKQRIAMGAGVGPSEIDALINKFEQSLQYVKIFKKMGHFNNFFK